MPIDIIKRLSRAKFECIIQPIGLKKGVFSNSSTYDSELRGRVAKRAKKRRCFPVLPFGF